MFREFCFHFFLSAFTLGGCSERQPGPSFEGWDSLQTQRAPDFLVCSGCHHSFLVPQSWALCPPDTKDGVCRFVKNFCMKLHSRFEEVLGAHVWQL